MLRHLLFALTACLLLAAILLAGCTNTIRLPAPPADDRAVYLVDFGRHTRLAFELPDGTLIEYGYGEWKWYARMEDHWWRAPAVLLWPTQGTLGRREWPGPQAHARLLQEYDGLTILQLPAAAQRVDALVGRLGRDFSRRSGQVIHNIIYRLDFVPYSRSYWLFNNSNHAVKEWLEELGFEVTGSGIFAEWRQSQEPPTTRRFTPPASRP
ncbi:MAG: hypothetical protein WD448_07875 [Woeseia sp.]